MHYTVFIGRFQPAHLGHISVIRQALSVSDHLIVVVGSRNGTRTTKNPFRFDERVDIIEAALKPDEIARVSFVEVYDTVYNNTRWVEDVQSAVFDEIRRAGIPSMAKISLIGHSKDKTSFYLKLFPEWHSIEAPDFEGLNATDLRHKMFEGRGEMLTLAMRNRFMEQAQFALIVKFSRESWFKDLVAEHEFIKKYKKDWGDGQFNTVDAVVTCGGHILLIQRKKIPGRGAWALPGGFLNKDERIIDGVIRELREETQLKVPEPVLLGSIDAHDVYDVIDRDPRGRMISHAYHFNLLNYGAGGDPSSIRLPKVHGADDAEKAQWVLLSDFEDMKDKIFADHYDLARDLIGRSSKKWY